METDIDYKAQGFAEIPGYNSKDTKVYKDGKRYYRYQDSV